MNKARNRIYKQKYDANEEIKKKRREIDIQVLLELQSMMPLKNKNATRRMTCTQLLLELQSMMPLRNENVTCTQLLLELQSMNDAIKKQKCDSLHDMYSVQSMMPLKNKNVTYRVTCIQLLLELLNTSLENNKCKVIIKM